VKNLFEMKNARRCARGRNIMQRNWVQFAGRIRGAVHGARRSGRRPLAVVEDVVFSNNHCPPNGSGINIIGHGGNHAVTRRISPQQTSSDDVSGESWGGRRPPAAVVEGADDIVFDPTPRSSRAARGRDGGADARFVFNNNIAPPQRSTG
jgi:hypothetical protein